MALNNHSPWRNAWLISDAQHHSLKVIFPEESENWWLRCVIFSDSGIHLSGWFQTERNDSELSTAWRRAGADAWDGWQRPPPPSLHSRGSRGWHFNVLLWYWLLRVSQMGVWFSRVMKLRFRSLFVRCSVLHVSPRAPPCVYSTVTQVNYDDKWKEKSYRHKSAAELHSLTVIFDCLKSKQMWNQHLLMHTLYPVTPPFIHLWFHQNKVHTHHEKVHVSPKHLELKIPPSTSSMCFF